jgi:hypothetical protein
MIFSAIQCEICGRQKQETNHWLVAITGAGFANAIVFVPAESAGERESRYKYDDLCGEGCALKRLSRWLSELKAASSTPK